MITEKDVLEVLGQIVHPVSGKDIVAMGIVKDLKAEGRNIRFSLEFSNFNDPLKTAIRKTSIKQLKDRFGENTEVDVEVKTKTPPPSQKPVYLPGVKNIVAVASGKGGVGKSTIAVNLAVAFALKGLKTGLIDADIFGPSVPKMMRSEFANPSIKKVNGKDVIEPAINYGVKTLSIGYFLNAEDATIWRGPMASNAFQQLMGDADWGELDYMFIDLPPGTSDIHLTLVQSVSVTGAVIVTTPQDVALADAIKGINMFRSPSVNVPVLGLIENMSWFTPEEMPDNRYYIFGKDGSKKLSEKFDLPLLGQIPLVQGIREGGDSGEPPVLNKGQVSDAFMAIADKLEKQVDIRNSESGPTQIVEITRK